MRKNCETCKHDDAEFSCYPHKTPCNECLNGKGCNDAPTKWEAAEHYKPDTNADRIRAMSDEELEDFLLAEAWTCDAYETCSVCPFHGEIGKGCMSTLEWLKQPAEVANDPLLKQIVFNLLDKLPTVDSVEVVRCKDCKEWLRNCGVVDSPNGHCFHHETHMNGYDFCSYGERRTDDRS